MNISVISRPNAIKFYLKCHWGRGKTALCFGADRIKTLVFMATESFMRKTAAPPFLECFDTIVLYLQVTRTCIKAMMTSKFGQI